MTYNQEYLGAELDTLAEERAFSVESSDGATFHFGSDEGAWYLIGVSFLFSAEFTSLFHLACVDGKGQKTEDYELIEPDMLGADRDTRECFRVEFAGRVTLYKVSNAEVAKASRTDEAYTRHEFEPSINPTQDWLKRAAQEGV